MRPTNQTKKMVYGIVIVALLVAMVPATARVNRI